MNVMVIMSMIIFVKLNWRIMLLISSLHTPRHTHTHTYGAEVQVMLVVTLFKIMLFFSKPNVGFDVPIPLIMDVKILINCIFCYPI